MAYIVLLGAGASYGSGDVDPYPPPLGNKLFEELELLGKTASRLPKQLKEIFKENFEHGMKEYFIYSERNVMSFQRELAGYLAKFTPKEKNNYSKLIDSVNTRRVIFASLNYDLMLEIAASRKGLNTNYSNKHHDKHIRLLKIHGSSNFWHDNNVLKMHKVVIRNSTIDFNAPIKPLSQRETIWKAITEDSSAPAISMFAEGKEVRVNPGYVFNQQKMWFESLLSCPTIFIIGVRVHQVDEHIWTKIAQSKAHVHYYGFKSDEIEFNDWKEKFNRKNATFHLSDFTQAVPHISRVMK